MDGEGPLPVRPTLERVSGLTWRELCSLVPSISSPAIAFHMDGQLWADPDEMRTLVGETLLACTHLSYFHRLDIAQEWDIDTEYFKSLIAED